MSETRQKMIASTVSRTFGVPAALIALVALGCAEHPLSNSASSAEELAQAVLDGLEAEDREVLDALLVTEEEHRDLLWEHLPESNDLTFEVAREWNVRNSQEGLGRALNKYGGTEFEFVRIEFTDDPEVYETFTLHRGTKLWVRRVSDGEEGNLPILDVVLELDGRWKLMNFEE